MLYCSGTELRRLEQPHLSASLPWGSGFRSEGQHQGFGFVFPLRHLLGLFRLTLRGKIRVGGEGLASSITSWALCCSRVRTVAKSCAHVTAGDARTEWALAAHAERRTSTLARSGREGGVGGGSGGRSFLVGHRGGRAVRHGAAGHGLEGGGWVAVAAEGSDVDEVDWAQKSWWKLKWWW